MGPGVKLGGAGRPKHGQKFENSETLVMYDALEL